MSVGDCWACKKPIEGEKYTVIRHEEKDVVFDAYVHSRDRCYGELLRHEVAELTQGKFRTCTHCKKPIDGQYYTSWRSGGGKYHLTGECLKVAEADYNKLVEAVNRRKQPMTPFKPP